MDIKELKEIIADLPDEMKVGGSGHYGELLEVEECKIGEILVGEGCKWEKILSIKVEWEGEEPE